MSGSNIQEVNTSSTGDETHSYCPSGTLEYVLALTH